MLDSSNPLKISIHCTHLSSIYLKSHPYREDLIISDFDLDKVSLLSKITSLNVSHSVVTDKGIAGILKSFTELK